LHSGAFTHPAEARDHDRQRARQLVWYIFGQAATLTDAWGTCQLERFEQAVDACLFSTPQ